VSALDGCEARVHQIGNVIHDAALRKGLRDFDRRRGQRAHTVGIRLCRREENRHHFVNFARRRQWIM
jgi:hypothetical protein